MTVRKTDRRGFLTTTAAATAAMAIPTTFAVSNTEAKAHEANDRLSVGLIGCGGQGFYDAQRMLPFGDLVAVADVDQQHAENGKEKLGGGKATAYEDYRRLLDRKDIDAVIIGTPDHWHTKIAIDAVRSGKDVYCEKPLTLTIDEGKKLCAAVKETGRVFQVGTQQRSEPPHLFLKAIAVVREGRLGAIKSVQAAIGGAPSGGPFVKSTPPKNLNWDFWLGQAPLVDYIPERCHGNFRWWYEYSGGKLTDWGAHHVDIAHWALGADNTGPVEVEGSAIHPMELRDGYPTSDTSYNTALEFMVTCRFADGREIIIRHDTDNGCLITGESGRIFVNRERLTGKPIEDLADNPLPEDAIKKVYGPKEPGYHMKNFVECVKDRSLPISDVYSHHRAITTCHLANIAIRLGRKIKWDPVAEEIVGDPDASRWVSRPQRAGFEIV